MQARLPNSVLVSFAAGFEGVRPIELSRDKQLHF
jgi:hypothetical protein